jgi:hypothetical protein
MYGLVFNTVENFAGGTSEAGAFLVALLAVVAVIAIQCFIVQWLWNNVLVGALSVARPLRSVLHALGLLILIGLIHPGTASASVASY